MLQLLLVPFLRKMENTNTADFKAVLGKRRWQDFGKSRILGHGTLSMRGPYPLPSPWVVVVLSLCHWVRHPKQPVCAESALMPQGCDQTQTNMLHDSEDELHILTTPKTDEE